MTTDVQRLTVRNLGPIVEADVEFGDLTVLVGPQATGKSIFLQMLKLVVDAPSVQRTLLNASLDWKSQRDAFLQLYLGEGMDSIVSEKSELSINGQSQKIATFARKKGYDSDSEESVFYIPAQRVLSMRDGITHPFSDYRFGDPFSLREFSDKLHGMVQSEFIKGTFFPQSNRLKKSLRELVKQRIYGKLQLTTDTREFQKRIVLKTPEGAVLPYLVWSAGQREFTPLLLGLYWLLPSAGGTRRKELTWAIIEEPEMGLHPAAISSTMALVLELLARDYKVCLSTHSPHVLDVVWALRFLQENGGTVEDVKAIFSLAGGGANKVAKPALSKTYRTYYFPRGKAVQDISSLDPGAEQPEISGWGGLTGFSDQVGEIVARVAARLKGVA